MGRDNDQPRCVPVACQSHGRVEPRLLAQADIDQHDVRPQRPDALDRLGGTGRHPDDGQAVAFQQGPRRCQKRLVVID
jgi:hypothetical protein